MKPAAKLFLTLTGSIVAFLATSQAQVLFNGSYTQDFNTLPITGNPSYAAWTDNSTLLGWYAAQELGTFQGIGPTSGTGTIAALKSFGASGNTERALGSIAGDTGSIFYGIRLKNNTDETITQVTISYYGETWRQGITSGTAEYQKLLFSYSQNATGISENLFGTGVSFSNLDYTSTVLTGTTTGTAAAVNGNLAANRTLVTATLTLGSGWAPGTDLWLRWTDINDNGSTADAGLGIDNLSVASIPEPGTLGLLAAGGTWLLFFAHRRRNAVAAL